MIELVGQTKAGADVHAIMLAAGDLRVRILTLGAILNDVRFSEVDRNLTTAPAKLADYEDRFPYHGSLIGPVVNRLSGASAPIGGRLHQFEKPDAAAVLLHSGAAATCHKVWSIDDASSRHATLSLTLPHGDGGFPGTRHIKAAFDITAPATLRLTVTGTTDRPTVLNFANHSYWNLDGTPTWQGHHLKIAADRYLPTTAHGTPTGDIASVDGTPLDFRTGSTPAPAVPPLDHNFCLSDAPTPLRDVLWLTGKSGIQLTLATTAPAVQVYDGRGPRLDGQEFYQALAIEAQNWADAPNHPGFPPINHTAERPYSQTTEWRFEKPIG